MCSLHSSGIQSACVTYTVKVTLSTVNNRYVFHIGLAVQNLAEFCVLVVYRDEVEGVHVLLV